MNSEAGVGTPHPDTASLDEAIAGIEDQGFRSRFTIEYNTVSRWSDKVGKPGSHILDFGCGQGIAALGFALRHPATHVSGIDIGRFQDKLQQMSQQQLRRDVPDNLSFHVADGVSLPFPDSSLDLVYSWSVFEHIRRDLLPSILADLLRVLKPDGQLFIQIEPLYFSPRGAHLYGILDESWVHLLHQHDVLREKIMGSSGNQARKEYLLTQYESLNRITVDELVDAVMLAGFDVKRRHVTQVGITPPSQLLAIYRSEVLTTNSICLLVDKRVGQDDDAPAHPTTG
jgi:ubiquinone/menaquinone biosynthesis C-methylase UbiE